MRVRRLVCAFVISMQHRHDFSRNLAVANVHFFFTGVVRKKRSYYVMGPPGPAGDAGKSSYLGGNISCKSQLGKLGFEAIKLIHAKLSWA